jgi:hypothetical protein
MHMPSLLPRGLVENHKVLGRDNSKEVGSMVQGIVIPAETEQPLERRDFARLEDYQAVVRGWIEAVDLPDLGVTIYVNEEGLLRQLPFNSRASFLLWYYVPAARQEAMLVGDAVLVGLPGRDGNGTDAPREVQSRLLAPARYRVELQMAGKSEWSSHPATFPDFWEALMRGMVFLERIPGSVDVRVLPVEPDEIAVNDQSPRSA